MDIESHYTTVVIGAGPAGIMAARWAAERGSVLLVEALTLPRNKSCGGMLNEYAQAFISDTLNATIPDAAFSYPRRIAFRFFDFDRDIRRPTSLVFCNVDRQAFDEWLLGFLPANVQVIDNTRLIYCSQTPTSACVQLRKADDVKAEIQSCTCEYIVGADGPMGQTRRTIPAAQLAHYKTIQDFLQLEDDALPYFDCIYARGIGEGYGYGYLIPKKDHTILGSVFYPHARHAKAQHEKALNLYSSYYPYETKPTKREAWCAACVRSTNDICEGYGRVLLTGEAAGLFSPTSGEGISFALNSGMLCGQAIAQADEARAVLGKRARLSCEESDALNIYRNSLGSIRDVIERRLRIFPVINSDWGKWLGGCAPSALVDRMAHRI